MAIRETTIKSVELPTEPQDLPVLIKSRARVIGLTFEPSAEVRLDVEGTKLSFSVTEDDLEKSILLRGQDAFAVALIRGNKGRLLWIGNPSEVPRQLTPEERSSHILSRWEKTLERLAQ
jgi:hypothetical protein